MKAVQIVHGLGGATLLGSLLLGVDASPLFHSHQWLWVNLIVSLAFFQGGFTGYCPVEALLIKLGIGEASL